LALRKIIHIDCDCYYAALEMRDFPELRGRPVAVGGQGPRGVLSTCNYEARAFGVRSAMPTARARSLCPALIIQPSRFDVYRAVSRQMRAIFTRYTEQIEPLSFDEAFLDASHSTLFAGSATRLAEHLRAEIKQELGITVSAGVAPNKYLAKIASDWNKPNGLCVITPDRVADFVRVLPVERLFGVGQKTAERMHQLGFQTCGDLQQASLMTLVDHFGRFGPRLYQLARGEDERPVRTERYAKSLSVEHTYSTDLPDEASCQQQLSALLEELQRRLSKRSDEGGIGRVFLKMRFRSFQQTTVERALPVTLASFQTLLSEAWQRLDEPVRLLGLGVRFTDQASNQQLGLFEGLAGSGVDAVHQPSIELSETLAE